MSGGRSTARRGQLVALCTAQLTSNHARTGGRLWSCFLHGSAGGHPLFSHRAFDQRSGHGGFRRQGLLARRHGMRADPLRLVRLAGRQAATQRPISSKVWRSSTPCLIPCATPKLARLCLDSAAKRPWYVRHWYPPVPALPCARTHAHLPPPSLPLRFHRRHRPPPSPLWRCLCLSVCLYTVSLSLSLFPLR